MDAYMTTVRMSKTCPAEIDIQQYPHARRMALFVVGIIFFLSLQMIIQVVTLTCYAEGSGLGIALVGWSGIIPTLILGVVAARRMVLHKPDAMFLCKSFGWLLLAFKTISFVAIPLALNVVNFYEIMVNLIWVIAIIIMIWSQYGSPELMATFPRGWRSVSAYDVVGVAVCALCMAGLPYLLMHTIL